MRVTYSISRRVPGRGRKRFEHRNGVLMIRRDADLDTIERAIRRAHPRWHVIGYGLPVDSKWYRQIYPHG